MPVCFSVFCTISHRGRLLIMGRTSGTWRHMWLVGIFCRSLGNHSLWPDPSIGAYLAVSGHIGGVLS